ncbi:ubiquitin-like protein 4A isoform X1 [Hydra vulgaris]|uniref:ubiquitin-like protein 4A isoform X1 n=1 Tax=Hydra vulgaris TaxID=6087 RepID=UPI001F5F6A5B|nr:ubiquitin-like protein 4A [Hydra vulgaris]
MELTIKILGGEEYNVTVDQTQPILYLKKLVEKKYGIPTTQQKLLYIGKTLGDEKTISECGIRCKSKINLIVMKNVTDSSSKYTSEDFWKTLEAVLLKYHSHSVAQNIISQFEKDYKHLIATMSLDDIERIASRSLKL